MKKLILISLISFLPVWLLQSGCEDFFERNLTGSVIDMTVPSDSSVLTGPAVDFWWTSLPGSSGYELQIVSPDFNNPVVMVTDTAVVRNTFRAYLSPGVYQWRIRAYNQSSVSSFFLQTLFISEEE